LQIKEVLHDSRSTLLYRVTDLCSSQQLVLKTLRPERADDSDEIRALIMEEWRGRRITSPFFAQLLPAEGRSCLYYLQTWHEGATLQRMLDSGLHFTVADAVQHGVRLMKGLSALLRLDVAHRDIKPDNIHIGRDGRSAHPRPRCRPQPLRGRSSDRQPRHSQLHGTRTARR
jgi:serine/threonine protein kinase